MLMLCKSITTREDLQLRWPPWEQRCPFPEHFQCWLLILYSNMELQLQVSLQVTQAVNEQKAQRKLLWLAHVMVVEGVTWCLPQGSNLGFMETFFVRALNTFQASMTVHPTIYSFSLRPKVQRELTP